MKFILLLGFALILGCTTPAHRTVASQTSEFLVDIQEAFSKLPGHFECTLDPWGLECVGRISGYPQDVRFFFPTHFLARSNLNLTVHLHGFVTGTQAGGQPNTAKNTHFKWGDFKKNFSESKRLGVWIAPEGEGKNETFNRYLSTASHWKKFIQEALKTLCAVGAVSDQDCNQSEPEENLADLVITGHSGSYRTIATLAMSALSDPILSKTIGIGLFDCSYALEDQMAKWALRLPPRGIFYSTFIRGTPTDRSNEKIRKILETTPAKSRVQFEVKDHPPRLRPGFPSYHDQILADHYQDFLNLN